MKQTPLESACTMKSPEHLKPQIGRFNLIPMVDVVFLLIIFFIVSFNMTQQDTAIAVDLPEAKTGTMPQEQQTKRLTISVPRPGTLYVGTESMDKARLQQLMVESRRNWGEDAEIRIRTNKNILYGEIEPILKMAAENGITHVTFAVTERSQFLHP